MVNELVMSSLLNKLSEQFPKLTEPEKHHVGWLFAEYVAADRDTRFGESSKYLGLLEEALGSDWAARSNTLDKTIFDKIDFFCRALLNLKEIGFHDNVEVERLVSEFVEYAATREQTGRELLRLLEPRMSIESIEIQNPRQYPLGV